MNNFYPKNIDFFLTEYCEMKCAFCSHSAHPQCDFTETNFNPIIIKEIVENSNRFGIYGDGEPLASPIFMDCIPDLILDNCEFYFQTSGILLNIKIIKELIKRNVTRIQFSIDAGDKETYTKMRGDYWDKLWYNIKQMIKLKKDKYKPVLTANMLICNSNIHTLPKLVSKLIEIKHIESLLIYRPNKMFEQSNWSNGDGLFIFDEEISSNFDEEYKYISASIDIARSNNFHLKAVGRFLNYDYQHTKM